MRATILSLVVSNSTITDHAKADPTPNSTAMPVSVEQV